MTQVSTTSTISRSVTAFRDLLNLIIEKEQKMLEDIDAELKTAPKGTLCLNHSKEYGKTYFSLRDQDTNHGISSDYNLIYILARKRYISIVGKEVETDIATNKKISLAILRQRKKQHRKDGSEKIRELLEDYAKAGLDIAKITMTPEQYRWMHSSFDSNPMNPEELIYETYSGILMRSKSERSIGNKLELYGIPYRYEQALAFDVFWMDDEFGEALFSPKSYYPDFTILTLSGEYLIWEHLGRADLYKYRAHTMEKISAYRQSGEVDHRHLILTFEADLIKLETIDDIIRDHILILGV